MNRCAAAMRRDLIIRKRNEPVCSDPFVKQQACIGVSGPA